MKKWLSGIRTSLRAGDIPPERTNNFNMLRFLAALLVVFGHSYPILGLEHLRVFGNVPIETIGVRIFFLISGYLIYQSWERDPHAGRYLVRRVLRIWPALVVVCLVTTLALGPIFTSMYPKEYFSSAETWQYLWKNILMVTEFDLPKMFMLNAYGSTVNISLWSLPVEVLMYSVLLLLLLLLRKPKAQKIGLVCMAVGLCVYRILMYAMSWSEIDIFRLAHYFFLGTLYNSAKMRRLLNTQWAIVALLVMLVIPEKLIQTEIASMLLLPYVVFSFALPQKAAFAGLFRKTDITYGLYLYAFPLQQILSTAFVYNGASVYLMFLVSFLITLPFALASWKFIERPAQRLSQRICAKSKQRSRLHALSRT